MDHSTAFGIVVGFTVVIGFILLELNTELNRNSKLESQLEDERHQRRMLSIEVRNLNRELEAEKPKPSPLPEIYTPEQMAARPARRWHEKQQDVAKALKWDDAAKGPQ